MIRLMNRGRYQGQDTKVKRGPNKGAPKRDSERLPEYYRHGEHDIPAFANDAGDYSEQLTNLVVSCVSFDPNDRPTFRQIMQTITDLTTTGNEVDLADGMRDALIDNDNGDGVGEDAVDAEAHRLQYKPMLDGFAVGAAWAAGS